MKRSSALTRASVATAMLGAVSWLSSPSFVGVDAPSSRSMSTQMEGWRFDNMLEGKNADRSLETSEGFWLGEVGCERSQHAQGLRYRMRASPEEMRNGIECPALFRLGPFKIRLGEIFGGTGNNDKLREVKRKLAKEGISAEKEKENEYWLKRYGHKRWGPKYVDQSGSKGQNGLLRGLAAWSGCDPLNEERGKTWIEADYGKPWIKDKKLQNLPGYVSKEQMQIEINSGKLLPPAPPAEKTDKK